MTTYILPAHMSESAVESILDGTYSRGITYLYSQWEDYTRVWFLGASQVIYRATPSYVSDDYLAVAWSDPRFEDALAKGLRAHEES